MSIIDRPNSGLRAFPTVANADTAAAHPLGGRYVSARVRQPLVEGSSVSIGTTSGPGSRGTYVTAPSPSPRVGGRYTYTS